MSHSVVIVCLKPGANIVGQYFNFADMVDQQLTDVLAPFDESAETERYKEFETGEPSEHWALSALRRAVDHVANGTGIKRYEPDAVDWSSSSSKKTEDEQRAELEREAALYATLPETPTWADVVRVYREWIPRGEDENPDDGLQYDEETALAFEWSTYPKNATNERGALVAGARWDWWVLGGRWTGYFRLKDAAVSDSDTVNGRPGLMTETNRDDRKTDAAPKKLLDFEAMRAEKADAAAVEWWAFDKIAKQYPETQSWKQFRDRVESGGLSIEQAREGYREQPGVEALHEAPDAIRWLNDPYRTLRVPLERYTARASDAAVPGWALLTLDGEWWERGTMGGFGFSDATEDSEAQYNRRANEYLENLPDDVILAAVDVHI